MAKGRSTTCPAFLRGCGGTKRKGRSAFERRDEQSQILPFELGITEGSEEESEILGHPPTSDPDGQGPHET